MNKQELKAKAYDLLVVRQQVEAELAQVNQAIANYKDEEVKEDPKVE